MENVLINALAEAFNVAVQKQVAQQLAALSERIAALEYQSTNRHERLRVLEGALTDRVAALEDQTPLSKERIEEMVEDHAHGIVGELAAGLAREITQKVADSLDLQSEVENALNDIDFSGYIDTDDIATAAAEQVREDFDFKSEVRAEVREALDNFTISLNVR